MKLATHISALLLLVAGCGQSPSFHDNSETMTRRSANGTIDDYGQPVGGNGEPGDAIAGGPDGGAADTTGDREPDRDGPAGRDDGQSDGGSMGDDGAAGGDDGMGKDDGTTDDPDGDDSTKPRKKLTREMTFPSHLTGPATATQDLEQAYLMQELTLRRQYTDKTRQVKQLVRPALTDNFEQGYPGAPNTEAFDQVAGRVVDILVVIDNSGSMAEEQNNLAGKLQPLLTYVQDTDWQIGVVTTDPNQTCLRKLIKKGDANAATMFRDAVTAGTMGSNNERGVLQAVRSFKGECLTQPWIRRDSTLATLIVSDEDNCSDGQDCPGKAYASGDYLYDYLAQIREPGKNARVYGIIWHPSQSEAQCPTALNKGVIYADLIARTSGTWGSICDDDYSATLSEVSKNILVSLNSKFTLTYTPDPGTLRVFLGQQEVTTGFTVTGKVVEFSPPPPEGTRVTFSYQYGSVPLKRSFQLRDKPLAGRVAVTVDGVLQTPDTYTVDVATNVVTFAATPAPRARIVAAYTKDMPLTQQWELGDVLKAGSTRVYVDGMLNTDVTVTDAIGLVRFAVPPAEGATIDFAYTAVGNPVYVYPLAVPYGQPRNLMAYDSFTLRPVAAIWLAGTVTIAPTDYVEGRKVTFRYDNVARQRFEVMLPSDPLPGTIAATGGQTRCDDRGPYLKVMGRKVSVEDCGFADDVLQVSVSYEHVVQAYTEFTFAADKLPAANAWQEWRVWVNDVQSNDWTRSGNVIRFPTALPFGSVVKIQLIQEDK